MVVLYFSPHREKKKKRTKTISSLKQNITKIKRQTHTVALFWRKENYK